MFSGNLSCPECGKKYKSLIGIKKHFNCEHPEREMTSQEIASLNPNQDSDSLVCGFCNKAFQSQSRLHNHLLIIHPDQADDLGIDLDLDKVNKEDKTPKRKKNNICSECGRGFLRRKTLRLHILEEHGCCEDKELSEANCDDQRDILLDPESTGSSVEKRGGGTRTEEERAQRDLDCSSVHLRANGKLVTAGVTNEAVGVDSGVALKPKNRSINNKEAAELGNIQADTVFREEVGDSSLGPNNRSIINNEAARNGSMETEIVLTAKEKHVDDSLKRKRTRGRSKKVDEDVIGLEKGTTKSTYQKPYVNCVACERKFRSVKTLSNHMKLLHKEYKTVLIDGVDASCRKKCPYCVLSFAHARTLSSHVQKMHAHLEPCNDDSAHLVLVTAREASEWDGPSNSCNVELSGLGTGENAEESISNDSNRIQDDVTSNADHMPSEYLAVSKVQKTKTCSATSTTNSNLPSLESNAATTGCLSIDCLSLASTNLLSLDVEEPPVRTISVPQTTKCDTGLALEERGNSLSISSAKSRPVQESSFRIISSAVTPDVMRKEQSLESIPHMNTTDENTKRNCDGKYSSGCAAWQDNDNKSVAAASTTVDLAKDNNDAAKMHLAKDNNDAATMHLAKNNNDADVTVNLAKNNNDAAAQMHLAKDNETVATTSTAGNLAKSNKSNALNTATSNAPLTRHKAKAAEFGFPVINPSELLRLHGGTSREDHAGEKKRPILTLSNLIKPPPAGYSYAYLPVLVPNAKKAVTKRDDSYIET